MSLMIITSKSYETDKQLMFGEGAPQEHSTNNHFSKIDAQLEMKKWTYPNTQDETLTSIQLN